MNNRLFQLIFPIASLAIAAIGCSGGSDNSPDGEADNSAYWGSLPVPPAVVYTPGSKVQLAQATIDSNGGTIESPNGSTLEGVVVTIPAGAVTAPTTFTLSHDIGGKFSNASPDEHPEVISVTSDGKNEFDVPIKVEFPFVDATRFPVAYYIRADDGTLEVMEQLPVARQAGRGGFLTYHLSDFGYFDPTDQSNPNRTNYPVFSGFYPAKDGFAFSNRVQTPYAPIGRCEGMSAFAKWYKAGHGGGLAAKYTSLVPSTTKSHGEQNPSLMGQQVLATRAHLSIHLKAPVPSQDSLTQNITTVLHALRTQRGGVMMALTETGSEAGHVVLAIGADDTKIGMYDSNYPGMTKEVAYAFDGKGESGIKYSTYDSFGVWGNGELPPVREPYARILEDADQGFHQENMAKIEITSPADAKVTAEDVLLEGKVYSGSVSISEVAAQVHYADGTISEPQTTALAAGKKEFSLPLKVRAGNNYVTFKTRGLVVGGGMSEIPNTKDSEAELKNWHLLTWKDVSTPANHLTIHYEQVNVTDTTKKVTTVELNAPFIYYSAPSLVTTLKSSTWPFVCPGGMTDCPDLVTGASLDSFPWVSAGNIPITVATWHQDTYEEGVLTNTFDTPYKNVTCENLRFRITVEPGSTPGNYQYRVVLTKAGNITCPGMEGQLPPLPSSLSLDGAPTCQTPPRIQAADIDSWVQNPVGQKSFVLNSTADCKDGSSSYTENANVSITLVPCNGSPCLPP